MEARQEFELNLDMAKIIDGNVKSEESVKSKATTNNFVKYVYDCLNDNVRMNVMVKMSCVVRK